MVTGGDSDKNQLIIGLNSAGQVVYSFADNDGVPQKVLTGATISTSSFDHLLFGYQSSDNKLYAYLNGTRILDSVSDRPLNLISSNGYSIGAFAGREMDGINYSAFTGRIDEFRALTGDKSAVLTSRLVHTSATYTLTISGGDGNDYTFDAGQSDRNGEITDLTDPDINIVVGDTLVLDNNSGGHPIEIKDSSNNVIVSSADIIDGVTTWNTTGNAVGTYTYQCTVSGHQNMVGNIIVSATPETTISVPTAEFDSGSNTAILRHFNGDSAQLTAVLTNGSISSVTVDSSGEYYIDPPTVTIPAPSQVVSS